MARAVYYDPFGMRTNGYRAGVQDEIAIQDNTRRARAADWDYNNMAPLRLQQAQRADALDQFAQPYLQNQYGINQRANLASLFRQEQPNYESIGQATGNYAPALVGALNYGSGQSLGSEQFFPAQVRQASDTIAQQPQVATSDYIANLAGMFGINPIAFQQFLQQQTGTISPEAEVGYDQFLAYPRTFQQAQMAQDKQQQDWTRQVQQGELGMRQQQIDQTGGYYDYLRANAGAGAGAAGAAAGGYTGAEDGF